MLQLKVYEFINLRVYKFMSLTGADEIDIALFYIRPINLFTLIMQN